MGFRGGADRLLPFQSTRPIRARTLRDIAGRGEQRTESDRATVSYSVLDRAYRSDLFHMPARKSHLLL
jgi:hypothetical protein